MKQEGWKKYYKKRYQNIIRDLEGNSYRQLSNPRGLRGGTYGAANEGKVLSDVDKRRIELELKTKGLL